MSKIKVTDFPNNYLSELTENEITLYSVIKKKDINGVEYEILDKEFKYCNVTKVFGKTLYMSKEYLLEVVLAKDLEPLINKEIFEHGYPEGRLVPSNHYESCIEYFTDEIKETFNDMIDNLINDYS